jgi:hypothetical protein
VINPVRRPSLQQPDGGFQIERTGYRQMVDNAGLRPLGDEEW